MNIKSAKKNEEFPSKFTCNIYEDKDSKSDVLNLSLQVRHIGNNMHIISLGFKMHIVSLTTPHVMAFDMESSFDIVTDESAKITKDLLSKDTGLYSDLFNIVLAMAHSIYSYIDSTIKPDSKYQGLKYEKATENDISLVIKDSLLPTKSN